MAFLEIDNLHKAFGANTALHHFDMKIERGEFITFLGPSGCGKTTVLRMIAGFETPTRGIIRLDADDFDFWIYEFHISRDARDKAATADREKQIAVVSQLTDLVAAAANDPGLKERTWVLLTEAAPGGWGLWGHAHTNDELVGAARAEIAKLRS